LLRAIFSKWLRLTGLRPGIGCHRVAPVGTSLAAAAGWVGIRSIVRPGGSRARAMLTRQVSCEFETVPSLHSNLAGAASATGGGFSSAAACWDAGACAAGF
jgi:hypothetical protein